MGNARNYIQSPRAIPTLQGRPLLPSSLVYLQDTERDFQNNSRILTFTVRVWLRTNQRKQAPLPYAPHTVNKRMKLKIESPSISNHLTSKR